MRQPTTESLLRLQLQAREHEIAEAHALIADLHEQLDLANRATVRMARRIDLRRRVAA